MIRLYAEPAKQHQDTVGRDELFKRCWRGDLPAEVLDTKDRERLVAGLWEYGWTDLEIATHTRMSTYTTARIRTRLELPVRSEHWEVA